MCNRQNANELLTVFLRCRQNHGARTVFHTVFPPA